VTFCSQDLSSSHVNQVCHQAIFFFQVSSPIWSLLGLLCVDFGIKVSISLSERFFARGFDFRARWAKRSTDLDIFSSRSHRVQAFCSCAQVPALLHGRASCSQALSPNPSLLLIFPTAPISFDQIPVWSARFSSVLSCSRAEYAAPVLLPIVYYSVW
jgi:hypothetical protein